MRHTKDTARVEEEVIRKESGIWKEYITHVDGTALKRILINININFLLQSSWGHRPPWVVGQQGGRRLCKSPFK